MDFHHKYKSGGDNQCNHLDNRCYKYSLKEYDIYDGILFGFLTVDTSIKSSSTLTQTVEIGAR